MRVLVTGGAGFIGSHVVEALAREGHDVRVLDALLPSVHPTGRPVMLDDYDVHHADVRDAAALDAALRGVDLVCHQAAMVGLGLDFADAPEYVSCNELGTAVLLAAMTRAGIHRLVLASSMVVYGEGAYRCRVHGPVPAGPRLAADLDAGRFEPPCPHCGAPLEPGRVHERAPIDPRNVYAASKVAQEHLSASWARLTGGRVVALRYHNVYGPRMPRDTPYAGVASFFRSRLAAGEPPLVFEDGAQRRDFVHVHDIATANLAALDALDVTSVPRQPAPNATPSPLPLSAPGAVRAFNVGSGTPRTIGQMAAALSDAYGGPAPVVTGRYRLGDVRHVTAACERIDAELGWRAVVPFEAGVKEFATAPLRGELSTSRCGAAVSSPVPAAVLRTGSRPAC